MTDLNCRQKPLSMRALQIRNNMDIDYDTIRVQLNLTVVACAYPGNYTRIQKRLKPFHRSRSGLKVGDLRTFNPIDVELDNRS